ncbi:DUF6522 family protein [Halovulum sp. GXIMD14794]
MKVQVSADGITVDARDLGPLLGLEPSEVPEKMRSGEITSMHETGSGEDAGRFRVTFWHDGQRLRLTCAEDGTVISRVKNPGTPPRRR